MYQTYPSVKHCKKYGMNSIPGKGKGTSYPSKKGTTSTDSDGSVKRDSEMAGCCSPAASSYPQTQNCNTRFKNLDGLPR